MRDTVRTFLAVEIPPDVRERVVRLISQLRTTPTKVKWVAPDQLHWTLKFLGDVAMREIPDVCQCVSEAVARLASFDVETRGAGAFPTPERPHTVWVGSGAGTDELVALHDTIEMALEKLGYRAEQRRFRPHLTIGRVRDAGGDAQELASLIKANADFDAGLTGVYEVTLFSSQLGRDGPTYEPLCHAELKDR